MDEKEKRAVDIKAERDTEIERLRIEIKKIADRKLPVYLGYIRSELEDMERKEKRMKE